MSASNTPIRLSAASRLIPILVASVVIPSASTAIAETWTDLRGTHSVEAEMVGMWADNVVLKMSDGRRVTVKLGDLRSESRIQAAALSKAISESRTGRVKELQGQAAAAAAPAPNPLPKPAPAAAYVRRKRIQSQAISYSSLITPSRTGTSSPFSTRYLPAIAVTLTRS